MVTMIPAYDDVGRTNNNPTAKNKIDIFIMFRILPLHKVGYYKRFNWDLTLKSRAKPYREYFIRYPRCYPNDCDAPHTRHHVDRLNFHDDFYGTYGDYSFLLPHVNV